jgi:hypothetical protein
MTLARWFLVVSTLLFVTSVWFVLRTSPTGAAVQPPPAANVRQLMLALVIPSSQHIYDAAGTVSTLEGTIEMSPRDDREWEIVAAHAAVLIEASRLLRAEGRVVPDAAWTKAAADMEAGARNVIAATLAQDVDELLDRGGEIVAACDDCHAAFMPSVR